MSTYMDMALFGSPDGECLGGCPVETFGFAGCGDAWGVVDCQRVPNIYSRGSDLKPATEPPEN